jgi:hypothetical protein
VLKKKKGENEFPENYDWLVVVAGSDGLVWING